MGRVTCLSALFRWLIAIIPPRALNLISLHATYHVLSHKNHTFRGSQSTIANHLHTNYERGKFFNENKTSHLQLRIKFYSHLVGYFSCLKDQSIVKPNVYVRSYQSMNHENHKSIIIEGKF